MDSEFKPLTEQINYRKAVWLFGFVKTNVSGVLISSGVTILLSTLLTNSVFAGYKYYGVILGITAIICGEIGTAAIDYWKEKDKKKELQTIDKQILDSKKEVALERELMRKEAADIAHELVEEELHHIEEQIHLPVDDE